MSSKIIKLISLSVWGLSSFLAYSEPTPSGGIWDMIVDTAKDGFLQGINEGSRSEIQNIFSPLANIRFSNASETEIMKAAGSLGLSNPTAENAMIVINQRSNSLKKSPLTNLYYKKLALLGYPEGNPFLKELINKKIISMKKDRLEDLFSTAVINSIRTNPDSLKEQTIYSLCAENPRLTALINANPECLKLIYKEPYIVDVFTLPALNYFTSHTVPHTNQFKPGAIPNPKEWNFSKQGNEIVISSQKGIVARVSNNNLYSIGNDISLLNCELPPFAEIKIKNKTIKTDAFGRVKSIVVPGMKDKFKDVLKQQLKTKEIVACKGDGKKKPLFIIPKDMGGSETWNNIIGLQDLKENKQALKMLNKGVKEAIKNGRPLTIKIDYISSTSKPGVVRYYDGSNEICKLYAEDISDVSYSKSFNNVDTSHIKTSSISSNKRTSMKLYPVSTGASTVNFNASVSEKRVESTNSSVATPKGTAVWKMGLNTINGDFTYQGADYGFSLKIEYVPNTGEVYSISYAPKATGKFSKIQGTVSISEDGDELYIDGKTADGVKTEIIATAAPGTRTFSGTMTRGTHSGTCRFTVNK